MAHLQKSTAVLLLLFVCASCRGDNRTSGEANEEHSAGTNAVSLSNSDDNTFRMQAAGEVSFEHEGAVSCSVYEEDLLVSFAHDDMFAIDYELRVPGVTGGGTYTGTVVIEKDGSESSGKVELVAEMTEGDILPDLVAELKGTFDGAAGSGTLEGTFSCATDLGNPAETATGPKTGYWIEYQIGGDFDISQRDEETIMCGMSDDGLDVTSVGGWKISIESEGMGPGRHPARFRVSPPQHLHDRFTDEDVRNMYRIEGSGTITVEDAGRGQYGFALVNVDFTADELTSASGITISLSGSLHCATM